MQLSRVLFLKPPSMETLNSPACVRVWEKRREYCSPSHKSSCAHKGKYLCWASSWQPIACLFFSLISLLCFAVQAFIILLRLCLCPRSSSPTHSFSCAFSVSTAPSNSLKCWIPSSFLTPLPPIFPGKFPSGLGKNHLKTNEPCVCGMFWWLLQHLVKNKYLNYILNTLN